MLSKIDRKHIELSKLSTFNDVISYLAESQIIDDNLKLHIKKWGSHKHWLKSPKSPLNKSLDYQSIAKTFSMTDDELIRRNIFTRQGDRSPSTKVKNLILGWLAEEIVAFYLSLNINISSVHFVGIDKKRVVAISSTPTDPDLLVELANGKKILVEVVSISKNAGDGNVRIKYNKIQQNVRRFFALKKTWNKYFGIPTVYIAVDMINPSSMPLILGATDFYGDSIPYPFGGWENQLVINFDIISGRFAYDDLKNMDLIKLMNDTSLSILKKNKYLSKVINVESILDQNISALAVNDINFRNYLYRFQVKYDETMIMNSHAHHELTEILARLKQYSNKDTLSDPLLSQLETDINSIPI
jgi:hypothetical protein